MSMPLLTIKNNVSDLNSNLITELDRLKERYLEPLLDLSAEEAVKYIEDNLTNFSADYIKVSKMVLEEIGMHIIQSTTEQFNIIFREIENSDIAQNTKEKLLDVIETEFENELYLLNKLPTLVLIESELLRELYELLELSDDNFKMINMRIYYYLLAILYLLDNYRIENNDKIDKLTVLLADYIEEKDAIIETLDIILNKERKEALENAMKEEGKIFESVDEALQYLSKD